MLALSNLGSYSTRTSRISAALELYLSKFRGNNTSSGQSFLATNPGMPLRQPNFRAT